MSQSYVDFDHRFDIWHVAKGWHVVWETYFTLIHQGVKRTY